MKGGKEGGALEKEEGGRAGGREGGMGWLLASKSQ